jgi:hypothetical protein
MEWEVGRGRAAGLPAASLVALCGPAVRRLQEVRRQGRTVSRQVRVVAEVLGVGERGGVAVVGRR